MLCDPNLLCYSFDDTPTVGCLHPMCCHRTAMCQPPRHLPSRAGPTYSPASSPLKHATAESPATLGLSPPRGDALPAELLRRPGGRRGLAPPLLHRRRAPSLHCLSRFARQWPPPPVSPPWPQAPAKAATRKRRWVAVFTGPSRSRDPPFCRSRSVMMGEGGGASPGLRH